MGLPDGWVCDLTLGLTTNQMITALGNGVLPLQATSAIQASDCLLTDVTRRPALEPGSA